MALHSSERDAPGDVQLRATPVTLWPGSAPWPWHTVSPNPEDTEGQSFDVTEGETESYIELRNLPTATWSLGKLGL